MANRKQFLSNVDVDPVLERLLERARNTGVDEEILQEQRISFAYGNSLGSDNITKESVRAASKSIKLAS